MNIRMLFVVGGQFQVAALCDFQDKRTQIDKEFTVWLKECHEKHDKQILFSGFKGVKTRGDLPRQRQYPWSFYTQVEWDGRVFKKGQMVRYVVTVVSVFALLPLPGHPQQPSATVHVLFLHIIGVGWTCVQERTGGQICYLCFFCHPWRNVRRRATH